jgi:hypothetical protein
MLVGCLTRAYCWRPRTQRAAPDTAASLEKTAEAYINLGLTWAEPLAITSTDWKIFRKSCNAGLTLARARRWDSNVILD